MSWRYRKSVNLGPFRLNFSKSGIGYSVGGKFFRVTKKATGGVRSTTTIPGLHLSKVTEYGGAQTAASAVAAKPSRKFTSKKGSIAGGVAALLLIAGALGSGGDKAPDPQPDTVAPVVQEQQEQTEPVDCSSITACFAEAFPDAEVACSSKPDRPEFTITIDFASDAQPEDWAQLMETFDTSLADADAAAKDLKQKTAFGQLVAADGTILASGYNGKLQFDLFAKRAADQAEADRIAAEKAVQGNQSTSSSTSSRTVYVTPTGSKYHYSSSCNGGSYSATTLDDAISRGLTPCKKCA